MSQKWSDNIAVARKESEVVRISFKKPEYNALVTMDLQAAVDAGHASFDPISKVYSIMSEAEADRILDSLKARGVDIKGLDVEILSSVLKKHNRGITVSSHIRSGDKVRHKETREKYTVIQTNCDVSASGDTRHLVVNKQGDKFKVKAKRLEKR